MRCKMRLTELAAQHDGVTRVRFAHAPDDKTVTLLGIDSHVMLMISDQAVLDKLELGKYYYVDFSPAPEPVKEPEPAKE